MLSIVKTLQTRYFISFLTHDIELRIALNSGLNESSGFISDTSVKISQARKRETTWCTSKLNQPKPNKAASMHRHRTRKKVNTFLFLSQPRRLRKAFSYEPGAGWKTKHIKTLKKTKRERCIFHLAFELR